MSEHPSQLGPYQLLEPLGQGSTGTVYRAHHRDTHTEVALKTVRLPHHRMLTAIRHEIYALSRLKHPGIVQIVDHGVEDNTPWYAMELLTGVSLSEYGLNVSDAPAPPALSTDEQDTLSNESPFTIANAANGTVPDTASPLFDVSPLTQEFSVLALQRSAGLEETNMYSSMSAKLLALLTMVRRVCETLAFLHGEGFVHCDLKPDNIIVRDDGQPVLLDFGLLQRFRSRFGRESMAEMGQYGGTPMYMAPEQILHTRIDARADLYALGCILYELLTGHPPYQGKSNEVLANHLFGTPTPPSRSVHYLPPALDALVLQLLARDPRERTGYADTVAAALEQLGAGSPLYEHAPRAKVYLYPPSMVGRKEAMLQLQTLVPKISHQRGDCFWLSGESGIGKTRLVAEFARWAYQKQHRVVTSTCPEANALPLEAFRALFVTLADHVRERGQHEQERVFGSRLALLAPYDESLRTLPGAVALPLPTQLPPQETLSRLSRTLRETLRRFAEYKPLVLIFDDLQWADELSLAVIQALAQDPPPHVMLVGTVRSEERNASLQSLLDRDPSRTLELTALAAPEIEAIVGDMLSLSEPPHAFCELLYQQSSGNPRFVGEYVQAAVEDELFWRDNLGRWHFAEPTSADARTEHASYDHLTVPLSLRELLQRRLDRLTPPARLFASCVAVLGRDVPLSLMQRVAEQDEWQMVDVLQELQQGKILQQREAHRVRFVHEQLRALAYDLLSPAVKQALHHNAAAALEAEPEKFSEFLHDLGHHWHHAGRLDRAYVGYRQAAEQAQQRNALHKAIRLYQRALSLHQGDAREEIALRHTLASVLAQAGRSQEALSLSEEATLLARSHKLDDLERKSLYREGVLHAQKGQLDKAHAIFSHVLQMQEGHDDLDDLDEQGQLLGNLANIAHEQGFPERALQLFQKALALLQQSGNRRREGVTLANLANVYAAQGRLPEALANFEQALRIHRAEQNPSSEAMTLANLGILRNIQKQYGRAHDLFQQALAIYESIDYQRGQGFVLGNLAHLLHQQGQHDEALQQLQIAISITRSTQSPQYEGIFLTYLHTILRRTGASLDTLSDTLDQAIACLQTLGHNPSLILPLCERGHLKLLQDQPANDALLHAIAEARRFKIASNNATEWGQAIRRLQRAVQAHQAHHLLRFGEHPQTLPPHL